MEDLTFSQLKQLHKKQKEAREEKYLNESKKRLEKISTTKVTTVFIGALDVFEKTFGFLWGSEDGPQTDEQDQWYELWQKARTQILDNGNAQLRALLNEIENHTISWKKYHMDLPVVGISGTNKER